MIKQLMSSRRFAPLFWAQFFSALNDNFLKNSLVMICSVQVGGADTAMTLVTIAGAVLIAPFFILSALGGELADKYDKALLARRLKFAEIFAAAFAAGGFVLQSVPLLMSRSACSARSPRCSARSNTASCPISSKTANSPAGNALIECGTFLAILIGPIAGGLFVAGSQPIAGCIVVRRHHGYRRRLLGFASRAFRQLRPRPPDLAITRNPWTSTVGADCATLKTDKRIWDGMSSSPGSGWSARSCCRCCRRSSRTGHRRQRERVHAVSAGVRDRRRDRLDARGAAQPCAAQSCAGADRRPSSWASVGLDSRLAALGGPCAGIDRLPLAFATSFEGLRHPR